MTRLIHVAVSGQDFYIHPQFDAEPAELLDSTDEPRVVHTDAKQNLEKAYDQLKTTLQAIAVDLHNTFRESRSDAPDNVGIEFALGFSTQVNAWVIGAE